MPHHNPVFHARHCRVPSKVPNGPSSRILLAVRSSSTSFHARLFDSVVRFGVSAGGAARLWCSTTIFFAKIYQFRVGFGNLYREAPFPRFTSARRFTRFGCSQDSYLYRPIRFDCSFDYIITFATPPCSSVRYIFDVAVVPTSLTVPTERQKCDEPSSKP